VTIRATRRRFLGGASALAASTAFARNAGAAPAVPTHVQEFTLQDAAETIEVTGIRFVYGNPAPLDGPGLGAINERFSFDYKPQLVPVATYIEKLSTQIAGGDIPDIIVFQVGDSNFYKWAGQGAFVDLTDLTADYETFGYVKENQWNLGRVNDGLYAVPQYYPPYGLTPSIRQDWLDTLGLAMPTSYDELKEVAVAFTEGDPTGTGRDTYGIAMGMDVNPNYAMGTYWNPTSWYHKDDQDRFVPGYLHEAAQELIAFHADLYQSGAVTRDFAVLDWAATNNEFYSGKAGIFIGAPRGMSQDYFAGLRAIDPEANCVPIPPFAAPDGNTGFPATSGAAAVTAFSAKLNDDQDKLKRILEFTDFCRVWRAPEELTPDNADVDWLNGGEGQGYEVVDGNIVSLEVAGEPKGLAPTSYFMEITPFPPTDDSIDYQLQYTKEPDMGAWAGALQKMWGEIDVYNDPSFGIISETNQQKGTELSQFLLDETTRMIAGQRGLDTWPEMIDEWKGMGGEQVIAEINAGIQERDA